MGDQLKRVTGLSGVLYVVLVVLGSEVLGGGGGEAGVTATRAEVASDLTQNPPTTTEWAGLYIEVIGLLFFVVFIAVLWSTLRPAEGSGGVFSAVVFGAGLLSAGIKLASLPAFAAALYRADEGFDPEVAAALIDMNNASFALTWGIDALMLAAVAVIVLRTAALPRWVGWSAAVLSLGLLVGMAFATSEFALPFLLTLIWIVVVSVLLFRRGSSLGVTVP